MLKKLIQINEQRKELETSLQKKKIEFETSIDLEKAQLEDLITKENKLRAEALLQLEKENKNSEKVGDKTIIKQIKITLRVNNPKVLRDSIVQNEDKLKDLIETNLEFSDLIDEAFEDQTIVKNKSFINDIIDRFNKVEGKLLDGVEKQETKFILIK